MAATTPDLLPDRAVAASTAPPPFGLLPDQAGSGSREFLALTTRRWGGLLAAFLYFASSYDSRSRAATSERPLLCTLVPCVRTNNNVRKCTRSLIK